MRTVNGIHNRVAFILTGVPRHFENNGHLSVSVFLRKRPKGESGSGKEEYRYWASVARDGEASAEERARAEEILESLNQERPAPQG